MDGQSVTVNGIDRIEKNGNRTQMYVKTQDFDSALQSTANRYNNLEVSQLRQAYYVGVNEETNAPKLYSKKEETRAEKKGGLLRNYTRKLSAEQSGSVYVMEALAKKYGFLVEVRRYNS